MLATCQGAGKSSVLGALTKIDGVEYSALESEQLAWGSPWLFAEQWLPQLAAVMALQRKSGGACFLLAVTTETMEELPADVAVKVRDILAPALPA